MVVAAPAINLKAPQHLLGHTTTCVETEVRSFILGSVVKWTHLAKKNENYRPAHRCWSLPEAMRRPLHFLSCQIRTVLSCRSDLVGRHILYDVISTQPLCEGVEICCVKSPTIFGPRTSGDVQLYHAALAGAGVLYHAGPGRPLPDDKWRSRRTGKIHCGSDCAARTLPTGSGHKVCAALVFRISSALNRPATLSGMRIRRSTLWVCPQVFRQHARA